MVACELLQREHVSIPHGVREGDSEVREFGGGFGGSGVRGFGGGVRGFGGSEPDKTVAMIATGSAERTRGTEYKTIRMCAG